MIRKFIECTGALARMTALIGILTIPVSKVFAIGTDTSPPRDPLEKLDYRTAFDQKAIHQQYEQLLTKLGCWDNVDPNSEEENWSCSPCSEDRIAIDSEDIVKEKIAEFEAACLKKLAAARRTAIMIPAREASTLILLLGGAIGLVLTATGIDSFGGSFGIFAGMFHSAYFCRDIIRSTWNLIEPPSHALDPLEKRFAINQCYIPQAIWDPVIERFLLSRSNPFEQGKHIAFIEFSLGLTIYKPKPPIDMGKYDINAIKSKISMKIDRFFRDYEDFEGDLQLEKIKTNVHLFVGNLLGEEATPRYMHLQGIGGIGKTHFAKTLNKIITHYLPKATNYEMVIVNAPDELEGSENRPSIFMRILRNLCLSQAHGSVVILDEANWLSEESYNAPSKRVFNGNQKELAAQYYGQGLDGTGIKLPMPPMLTLLASNKDTPDDALRSRFDCVNFPRPKKETLQKYARNLIEKDQLYAHIPEDSKRQRDKELSIFLGKAVSFRDVEAFVPPLVNKWYEAYERSAGN